MDNTKETGELVLQELKKKESLDSYEFSRETGRDHQLVVGAIKSLESLGEVRGTAFCTKWFVSSKRRGLIFNSISGTLQVIKTEQYQLQKWVLTKEGSEILQNGSHEVQMFTAVDPNKGTPQKELMVYAHEWY